MLIVRAAAVQILSMSMRLPKRSDRRTGLDLNLNGTPVLISADAFVRGVGIRDTRSGYTLRLYPASPCKCFLFALCAPHNGVRILFRRVGYGPRVKGWGINVDVWRCICDEICFDVS